MTHLKVHLFGCVQVTHDDQPQDIQLTRGLQIILAYLLIYRHRTHPRETLASLFWGDFDQDRARSCLNTALWRLRRALEPEGIPSGTYLLTNSRGEVGFNCESPHWLDVAVFDDCLCRAINCPLASFQPSDAEKMEQALALYTGELLEGFYEDWALRERERKLMLFLNSLAYLMGYYQQQGSFEKGLSCGQRILEIDPLREEVHREMMRLYARHGQRAMAVRQYEQCRDVLAAELNISPMPETQALYVDLLADAHPGEAPNGHSLTGLPGEPLDLERALTKLQDANQAFEQAQLRLQSAMREVEQLSRGSQLDRD